MVTLGLLPPYTLEDIHAAYREKAKTAHPDRGGTPAEFEALHEAYERAQEYMNFHQGRREWLASRMERYVKQSEVENEVLRLGGETEVEQIDWMKKSFGDFAVVNEMLRGIRLHGLADGDTFLSYLVEHAAALVYLLRLDVSRSRISDEAVLRLQAIESLQHLDLSGSPISTKALGVVQHLRHLRTLNLAGTSISWWARWRLRRSFPRLKVITRFEV
jgi:hypothetical protein